MHPVLVYIAAKAMTLGAYGCWRMVKKRRRERELWRRAGPLYDLGPDGSVARSEEASGQAEASGPDVACGPMKATPSTSRAANVTMVSMTDGATFMPCAALALIANLPSGFR